MIPSIDAGDDHMSIEKIIDKNRSLKTSTNSFQKCLSSLTINDVIYDKDLQHGLMLIARHYALESAKIGSVIIGKWVVI